jgi:hypothetical protein
LIEAFVVPAPNTANCFLHVSLHNDLGPTINNPPTNAYSLELTIKGKVYNRSNSIDPERYVIGVYKQEEAYDEDVYREEVEVLLNVEALFRVGTKAVELVPGTRVYGWLGFAVHYLPAWDTDQVLIGRHVEYDYDEDGVPLEESARPVDDFEYIPKTKQVEMLKLTVTDAFGQQRSAIKSARLMYLTERSCQRKASISSDLNTTKSGKPESLPLN